MGGIGSIVGAGLQGFASGGGFSKDGFKMDTFLGRESSVPKITPYDASRFEYNDSMFESQEYLDAVDPEDPNDI